MYTEALFYEKHNDKVKCNLCPHHCLISNGETGLCSVRRNENGVLKTLNYGKVTSIASDPIEKKPLYHFKPGKNVLSLGSFGCNFSCGFCQNYSIAQDKPQSEYMSSEKLIETSIGLTDNVGIAFTYNEPSIWYEYVYETSKKLKELYPDQKVILVTNGYIEKEPLEKILPFVDAMNIDLKAFSDDYYHRICGGKLEKVLETIERSIRKCHVEITTLMVNGLNDSPEEIAKLASYLGNLDKNIPLHLTRYFPSYKMDLPPTREEMMIKGKEVARKYLNYVYLGNISNLDTSTYCPRCQKLLIERSRFEINVNMKNNICPNCGYHINVEL